MTAEEQALLAAIAAARDASAGGDAADPYLVYADWLQERGDPRGGLIAVQLQLEARPDDAGLREREAALSNEIDASLLAGLPGASHATWQRGFATALTLAAGELAPVSAAARVRAVLAHPAAAFAGALELRLDAAQAAAVIPVVCDAACAPRLVRLRLRAREGEALAADSAALAALYRALPAVRELSLIGWEHDAPLGELSLLAPRSFELASPKLSRAAVADVMAARWPGLERLVLHVGAGEEVTLADLEPALARGVHPALCELGVMDASFTDALIVRLPYTALGPRLRALGIGFARLEREGLEAFARHREFYGKLALFDDSLALAASDHYQRGYVLDAVLGRPADALPVYREVIEREPESELYWRALGNAHYALEEYEPAGRAYRRALALTPRRAGSWHDLARAFEKLGRDDEALAAYERACAEDPAAVAPLNERGILLARRGQLDAGLACLRRAHALAPRARTVVENTASWLARAGHLEEALPCYDTLIEIDPENASHGIDKGWALLRLGRASEALPYFEAAARREPEWEYAHAGAGLALIGLGRREDGLAALARAREHTQCAAIAAMSWLSEAIARLGGLAEPAGEAREPTAQPGEARDPTAEANGGDHARALAALAHACPRGERDPVRLTAAVASAATRARSPDAAPVHEVCEGDPTEDRVECALIAMIAALLAGDPADARARADALLAFFTGSGAAPLTPWPWLQVELARVRPLLGPRAHSAVAAIHAVLEGTGDRDDAERALAAWSAP